MQASREQKLKSKLGEAPAQLLQPSSPNPSDYHVCKSFLHSVLITDLYTRKRSYSCSDLFDIATGTPGIGNQHSIIRDNKFFLSNFQITD